MLVKKVNPNWSPIEQPEIKVGEIRDVTDPKQLILNGDVVAIDNNGVEISPYELYGVIVINEQKEFEEWLKIKKATSMRDQLEKEKETLEAQIALSKKEISKPLADEDIRAKRLAALEKARAVRAANRAVKQKK